MKKTRVDHYYERLGIRATMINNKIFGNVYVIYNLIPLAKYPEKFIGLATKTNKFYLFDCICCDERDFVEYTVVELTYKDFFDMSTQPIKEIDLYRKHYHNIYSYLEDFDGIVYEKADFCMLYEDDMLPDKDEYIKINSIIFNKIIMLSTMLDNKLIE